MMSQDNRLLPVTPVDRSLDRPLGDMAATPFKAGYGAAATEPTHLREYLNVVLKRKWLILSLVVVITTLVTIQMYRMPSIYEAAATIQIEPKKESVLAKGRDSIVINTANSKDPAYWNTQLRLLENPTLARQVIKKLNLQNNPAFLGGQAQAGFVSSLRRIFASDKKPGAGAPAEKREGDLELVTEGEVQNASLTADEMQKLEPYEATLAANLTPEPVVGTNLVTLRYRHTSPELAQAVVQTLAETFVENNIMREATGSETAALKLREKVAEVQMEVKRLEDDAVRYAQQWNLPADPTGTAPSTNLPFERLQMLSRQLLDAENERKNLESVYQAATTERDPHSIPQVGEDKRIQDLRRKLDELVQKREDLLVVYTPEWPEVQRINNQIKVLEESLTKAPREVVGSMKKRYEAAVMKERSLRAAYDKQKGETSAQGIAAVAYAQKKSELETQKQYLATLRQRLNEIENTAGDRPNNVSITNAARAPRAPVGPPRMRTIMLAFLLSLGAGVGLAFLLDYLDDTLKTVDDVDRYLHLPSLALIPSRFDRKRLKAGRAPEPAEGGTEITALALTSDVRSPIAEAYRHLRTSLLLSSAGQPPKTILVTSSQPSEGKTTTAVNTAVMLAQTGAEVLIMDCDLRRPRIHANFGLTNGRGLTNYLSGEGNLDSLLQTYERLPNLKIMPSGPIPPNPAELLGSNEMRRLLGALAERFTHIVIDSPPAISFTDASILSTLVDGVMLVVHAGRSSRAVVRRAKQQLVDVGANIFGVVLNNVKLNSPDYYYYSNYYSGYYAEDDGGAAEGGAAAGAGR